MPNVPGQSQEEVVEEPQDEPETPEGEEPETPQDGGGEGEQEKEALEPGGESQEAGGGDPENQGGEGEGEKVEEEKPEAPDYAAIAAENKELRERIEKIEKSGAAAPKQEAKELSEEDWAQVEQETGLNRASIKFQIKRETALVNLFKNMIEQRFGKAEKHGAIASLAKKEGFQDISKYQDGIEEYLKKYDPAAHADEKVLTDAYYYAKGKGMSKTIKKVLNSKEINRKVMSKAKPSVPSAKSKAPVRLTADELDAAKRFKMAPEEYAKYKNSSVHELVA